MTKPPPAHRPPKITRERLAELTEQNEADLALARAEGRRAWVATLTWRRESLREIAGRFPAEGEAAK